MGDNMVAGYHLIWTVYGCWLPNDPRGSTSIEVRVEPIRPLGDLHYGRKTIQPSSSELRAFFEKAHDVLTHPVLPFDDDSIALVGKTIGEHIVEHRYTCYACAVMPDHVHLLIRRHRDKAEHMIEVLQERTRSTLIDAGRRLPTHPVWTKGSGWKGFINTREQFKHTVAYIRRN